MSAECYPITVLPHLTPLYRAYLAMDEAVAPVRQWYGATPFTHSWQRDLPSGHANRDRLADALHSECLAYNASPQALANVEKIRQGARAVVTGQQVALFGGPLLTLLKAATAVARAAEATEATGIEHVPVFWLASEDHDLPEVDQVSLPSKTQLEILTAGLKADPPGPVGTIILPASIEAVLDRACELLAYAPLCDHLREFYAPGETLARAFARLMALIFAEQGLIVMDAAGRAFHALGASTLRAAIERAPEFEAALLTRTAELEHAGYHAQVLVKPGSSLLFLLDEGHGPNKETGKGGSKGGSIARLPLRRLSEGEWRAGSRTYTTADLLHILDSTPERLSPNALLRPVFQDTILPTAAYIGGPAEIAYFAQSAVLYERIPEVRDGRITPVLPRLTATLIERALSEVMQRHELTLSEVMTTPEELAQRLGARAMPIEGKRKLAAAGNAMDTELTALTGYLAAMDSNLGRASLVSASKMRYQMNRLRRMAATFELQKETSLRKHADALTLHLFPGGHPQERILAGIWFLARYGEGPDGRGLIARLVTEAREMCGGHIGIRL